MKLSRLFALFKSNQASELPFFSFVSLVITLLAGWSIYDSPPLQAPIRLIPFVLLVFIHIGLYWVAVGLGQNRPLTYAYLTVQGILALLINLIGNNMALPFGLYMGLIGLAVGMYKLTRPALLFVSAYLAASVFCYSRVVGWGDTWWWLLGVVPALIFVVLYVMLYNRQTEARARAQSLAAELEAANRQLSEYASRVEALTLAGERQRMARELHDTLSQGLAGLILQLEAADAHLSSERPERAQAIIKQTMHQARAALAGARRAIDDLRQTPTDLVEAVRQETQRFTQATGIPCELVMNLPDPIPAGLCEPAQRAVAEALTNIARHAQASQVSVTVTGSAGAMLAVTVQDNGIGFDVHSAVSRPGHYGLLGIRERARLAGGTFEIDSLPGRGAKLVLCLPYTSNTAQTASLQEQP